MVSSFKSSHSDMVFIWKLSLLDNNGLFLKIALPGNSHLLFFAPLSCFSFIALTRPNTCTNNLFQAYTCLFKEKVAILADLRKDWTEDCINKLVVILDDLQVVKNWLCITGLSIKSDVSMLNIYVYSRSFMCYSLDSLNLDNTKYMYEYSNTSSHVLFLC